MPYIKPALRAYFTGIEKEIERVNIQDAGAFNYLVFFHFYISGIHSLY